MKSYIALIHKETQSDYSVSFPDFAGCVTAGKTLDEARKLAQQALEFHIFGMLEDEIAIPEPSSFEDVMACPENHGAALVVVDVETNPTLSTSSKSVRISITMPEDDLANLDHYAKSHGYSRSSFIVQAAKSAIEKSAPRN